MEERSPAHPKGRLSLRVINIATGETRFARVVDLAAEPFQSTDHKWATPLADALAQEVARQLLDAIFPTRILHVDANTAYLNTGGDLFRVGELLDIYALEGQLIDPCTGERLGPMERRVEQIRITSVSDKQAVAEVLEGRGSIAPGSICRPIAASSPESEPTPKAPLIEKPSVDSTW